MKQKKLTKKLTIKRTTIVNLDTKDQAKIKGGEETFPRAICDSFYRTCTDIVC